MFCKHYRIYLKFKRPALLCYKNQSVSKDIKGYARICYLYTNFVSCKYFGLSSDYNSLRKGSLVLGANLSLQDKTSFRNCSDSTAMVRILNVAEKNDAAKNLAEILSRGGYTRKEGLSKFNKIYEFDTMFRGRNCRMVMTSVSGHLLTHSFIGNYKKWYGCNPLSLFDAPVVKICIENMLPIKLTLEREAKVATQLIIWTDCDREGENIGFEIISVCKAIKPNLQVHRAKFSEITFQSVNRAFETLGPPDENQNNAVEVRSELDLRIGAAFTRFQTLRLQKVFPESLAQTLISYGSCQFPTLGFVVERYKAIEAFIPEGFWKIKVSHEYENCVVEFHWRRVRLFNELACQALHDKCLEAPSATVKSVNSKMKSKWRPLPLDTVEFEKLASRKLRLNAKEAMRIAESLYTSGFISYPRTETNIFPNELNLVPLVQMQTGDPNWGGFANRLLGNGPTPRQGQKSDQAHPPIHPTKYASNLQGNEQRVYEFIVRHFLACCDKDAKGTETIVEVDIAREEFVASGLIILERNYLDVYPYDKWSDKEMPNYHQGQTFEPTAIEMVSGQTTPPPLLTEADLIALMEKHGIGTDATHADHIETIKSRLYVGLQESRFVPGELGMGLVEGYDAMGFQMSKPHLRAELEADLKRICEGAIDPNVVLKRQIDKYREVFIEAVRQAAKIDEALARLLNQEPLAVAEEAPIPDVPQTNQTVMKCPSCDADVTVKSRRDNNGYYLSCQSYPDCKVVLWFPETVKKVEVLDQRCSQCIGGPKKLKFTFSPRAYTPLLPTDYSTCVGGCDSHFMETLDIKPLATNPRSQSERKESFSQRTGSDSGYSSTNSNGTKIVLSNRTNTNSRTAGVCSSSLPSQQNDPRTREAQNPRPVNPPRADPWRGCSNPGTNPGSTYNLEINSSNNPAGRGNGFKNFWNDSNDSDSAFINPRDSGLSHQRGTGIPFRGRGRNFGVDSFKNEGGSLAKSGTSILNSTGGLSSGWNDNSSNANAIVCNCNEDAIKLTVRKEGPNTGRQFYKCSKPQGQGCNFFLWADDNNDGGPSAPSTSNNSSWKQQSNPPDWSHSNGDYTSGNFSTFDGGTQSFSSSQFSANAINNHDRFEENERVKCNCGIDARRLTTLKEGANKGREFYVCPKTREEQCGFFQWVDEVQGGAAGTVQRSWQGQRGQRSTAEVTKRSARGGTKRSRPEGATPGKRKCGLCGEFGHDRRNCPSS